MKQCIGWDSNPRTVRSEAKKMRFCEAIAKNHTFLPQSGLYVGSNPIQYIPPSTKVAHEVLSSKKSIAGFRTPARSCVSRAAGTKAGVSPMQRAIFFPPTPNAGFEPESRIVRPPHVVTIGLRARTVRGFESHPIQLDAEYEKAVQGLAKQ